ncbi:MAG: cyclic nucleotide-binding domain-containing protein [Ilumatobacter sp.]|nr:cyclic nucleotide-binding domain-containing protein [Ilumatobacter sp.]
MGPRLTNYPVDTSVRQSAVTQAARVKALGKVPMFEDLSKRNLTKIAKLSTVKKTHKDEILVVEGQKGSELMVVLDGRAVVRRGKRKLGELGPGEVFGEMALLDDEPRSATVTALEPMRLLAVSGPAFRKLLPVVPALTEAVLAGLSKRLRAANAIADH